jgi:hypothetical protein
VKLEQLTFIRVHAVIAVLVPVFVVQLGLLLCEYF